MPSILAKNSTVGRKWLHALLAGVAGGALYLGSGIAYVAAENDDLDAILAGQDAKPCEDNETEAGLPSVEDTASDAACDAAQSESDDAAADEIDLGGDEYTSDEAALSADDAAVLSTLSDEEAQEVATLFDEEDAEPQETADIGSTSEEDIAAAEEPPAQDEGADIDLDEGSATVAAAPQDGAADAEGESQSAGGEGEGFDGAQAGSDSANYGGTIQGTGSLVALGIGEGFSNAVNDPTSLDSLADVVVGTDPNNGNKDNVAQVTALGGVTDGYVAVSALEVLDGDTDDPLGQVLAVDADNAPSGPGATPSIDGVAEVNLGKDPDGQSFNIIQVDVFDENFMPDGSAGLANVAVGDGLDEGFASLAGVSIAGQNNGEHDNLADIALGESFAPLAEPLSPLTGGVNDLGVALGGALSPVLSPLAGALP